jgi:hypothetical protein
MHSTMRNSRSRAVRAGIGAAFAAGLLASVPALAQQGTGMRAVFGFSQGFTADTNRELAPSNPGSSLVSTTGLSFGLRSETRTEQFSLQGQLNARLFDVPNDSRRFRFTGPNLSASYRRDAANSGIALSASYNSDSLAFRRPIDDFLVSLPVVDDTGLPVLDEAGEPTFVDVIILPEDEAALLGSGTRTAGSLSGRIDLGREGPIGFTGTASRRTLRYSVPASGNDSTFDQLGLTLRLRLSPITTGRIVFTASRFDAEDAVRTLRDRIGLRFGVRHEFSQVLVLDASLGPSRVITRERTPGTRRVSSGLDGDIGLTRSLRNGTVGLSLSAITDENGTRRSFRLNRALDLPRGALSGSIGLARNAVGEQRTVGQLTYRHDMPTGTLSLRANRDFGINIDDEVEAFTSLSVDYNHAINSLSSFNLGARYLARTDDSATVTATYRRALTPDWNLNMGYRFDSIDRAAGRTINHGVFLNISRSIDFGL